MVSESSLSISPSLPLTFVHLVPVQMRGGGGSNDTRKEGTLTKMRGPRWYQCWISQLSTCGLRQLRDRGVWQEGMCMKHAPLGPPGSGPQTENGAKLFVPQASKLDVPGYCLQPGPYSWSQQRELMQHDGRLPVTETHCEEIPSYLKGLHNLIAGHLGVQ